MRDNWDQTNRTANLGGDPDESSSFLVRIEFSGGENDIDYEKLHEYLLQHDFLKTVNTLGMNEYELLNASYLYLNRGEETLDQVHRNLKVLLLNFKAKQGLLKTKARFYVAQLKAMSVEDLVEVDAD